MRFLLGCALLFALLPLSSASAQQVSTTDWFPGPGSVGDSTYSGTVDQSSSANALSGWVVDTTAQGWSGIDDVQILDGLMGAGGNLMAHPLFQQNRPDVAAALSNPYWAASGWSATVTGSGP